MLEQLTLGSRKTSEKEQELLYMSPWLTLSLVLLHREKCSGPRVPTVAAASHGTEAGMLRYWGRIPRRSGTGLPEWLKGSIWSSLQLTGSQAGVRD